MNWEEIGEQVGKFVINYEPVSSFFGKFDLSQEHQIDVATIAFKTISIFHQHYKLDPSRTAVCFGKLCKVPISLAAKRLCRSTRTPDRPFVKVNGAFYCNEDGEMEEIRNDWGVTDVEVWVYALPQDKLKYYQVLKPLARFFGKMWEGVSGKMMPGNLLPPYHAILAIRLTSPGAPAKWMGLDCGKHGLGAVLIEEEIVGQFPNQSMLAGHPDAHFVYKFPNPIFKKNRPLQLYDILEYARNHAEPVSLSYFLNKYHSNPIQGITEFVNTTCWRFIDGALELFTDEYRMPQEHLEREFLKENAHFDFFYINNV